MPNQDWLPAYRYRRSRLIPFNYLADLKKGGENHEKGSKEH